MAIGSAFAATVQEEGTLVVGIGYTAPELASYVIRYKRAGDRASWLFPDRLISYTPHGMWADDPDFQGRETGRVVVQRLKPGSYDFYGIELGDSHAIDGHISMEAIHHFSVPFTIKPGEATYVGDFTCMNKYELSGPDMYMVLTDQHERDIPIAQRKMPNLGPVTIAVPDATTLGTNLIRAKEGRYDGNKDSRPSD
jgi:hypothetical protein